jgi:hypothetical protein
VWGKETDDDTIPTRMHNNHEYKNKTGASTGRRTPFNKL